jgi:hypothetical protein
MISAAGVSVDVVLDLPVLEPVLGKGAVPPGHVQTRVALVVLDLEGVSAFIRQPVAAGMAKHVRVDRKIQTGNNAGTLNEALKPSSRHRRTALADEHVRAFRSILE